MEPNTAGRIKFSAPPIDHSRQMPPDTFGAALAWILAVHCSHSCAVRGLDAPQPQQRVLASNVHSVAHARLRLACPGRSTGRVTCMLTASATSTGGTPPVSAREWIATEGSAPCSSLPKVLVPTSDRLTTQRSATGRSARRQRSQAQPAAPAQQPAEEAESGASAADFGVSAHKRRHDDVDAVASDPTSAQGSESDDDYAFDSIDSSQPATQDISNIGMRGSQLAASGPATPIVAAHKRHSSSEHSTEASRPESPVSLWISPQRHRSSADGPLLTASVEAPMYDAHAQVSALLDRLVAEVATASQADEVADSLPHYEDEALPSFQFDTSPRPPEPINPSSWPLRGSMAAARQIEPRWVQYISLPD